MDAATEAPSGSYVSKIRSLMVDRPDIKWSLEFQNPAVVAYKSIDEYYQISTPEDLIKQAVVLQESHERSVCIIENIDAQYLEALGTAWKLDPKFFIQYASNRDKDKLWWMEKWDWPPRGHKRPSGFEGFEDRTGHLDGVFEYYNEVAGLDPSILERLDNFPNSLYRHCFKDKQWPIQSSTRISYCRPNRFMYLFLVDPPVIFPPSILKTDSRSFPTLRFMNSDSRGGVEMPQLYRHRSQQYSVFENLKVFFEHGWHFRVLFMERTPRGELHPDLFPAHPLVYLIVSCLWEENLRDLDKEIKRISFKEIRNPKLEINAKLHDRREDLARIKEGLTETAMYVPKQVKTYFATYSEGTLDSRINQQNWDRLIEKAAKLDAFLMETFQLFMSSVSVQDSHLSIEQSRLSIEQAQRGSQLTFLAFIYVPLSFITGIFGMNVQQINSSGLNIWVCFVVLVPVIVITLLLFLAVKCYGHRKDAARKLTDHSEV